LFLRLPQALLVGFFWIGFRRIILRVMHQAIEAEKISRANQSLAFNATQHPLQQTAYGGVNRGPNARDDGYGSLSVCQNGGLLSR
jgi:hypothetical protein